MQEWIYGYKRFEDAYEKYADILSGRKEGQNPRIIWEDELYKVKFDWDK